MKRLLGLTPLLPLLAAVPGGRWALPLLAPLTVYAPFAARVRERDTLGAWRLALLWALLLSAGVILLVILWPEAARGILRAEDYRREMFGWVATGVAPENDWRQFLPRQLFHLGVFLLATWISGGYLGLSFGALLISFMSYFVGSYAVASGHPLLGVVAAWVPWSVLRVLSFVLLGAILSRPVLVRRFWPFGARELQLAALAVSGLAADVLIKALLAPGYGLFLRHWSTHILAALYSGAPGASG